MFIKEHIIDEAVDAIINARDFCGSEKEAVIIVVDDHKIKAPADRNKVWKIAKFRANARWNKFKREAGVNEKWIF
jgi:hypothetical protein